MTHTHPKRRSLNLLSRRLARLLLAASLPLAWAAPAAAQAPAPVRLIVGYAAGGPGTRRRGSLRRCWRVSWAAR
jgi:hypothetical protein